MNHRLGTVSKNTGEHVNGTITTLNSDVDQNNLYFAHKTCKKV